MVFSSLYITSVILNETKHDSYLDVIKIVMTVFLTTFTTSGFFTVLMYWSQHTANWIRKIHLVLAKFTFV